MADELDPPCKAPAPASLPTTAGRPPTRPARRRNPTRSLAAMLVGSVLAFPFSMFAIFFLEVIGGTTFWTARDMRNLALISGVVAGGVLVASVAKWRERSGESSQRARWLGWTMIVTSAAIIGVGTLYLATRTSPKNLRRPSASGSATLGSFLTAHHGRWTTPGAPLTTTSGSAASQIASTSPAPPTRLTSRLAKTSAHGSGSPLPLLRPPG